MYRMVKSFLKGCFGKQDKRILPTSTSGEEEKSSEVKNSGCSQGGREESQDSDRLSSESSQSSGRYENVSEDEGMDLACMIKDDPWRLEQVPYDQMTEELCVLAVSCLGEVLAIIPDNMKTKVMCTIAVHRNGRVLKYVPKNLISEEMCVLALVAQKWGGDILMYVPEMMRSESLCLLALCSNIGPKDAMLYVPEDIKKEEWFRVAAVSHDSNSVKHLTDIEKTPVVRTAVKTGVGNAEALQYISGAYDHEQEKRKKNVLKWKKRSIEGVHQYYYGNSNFMVRYLQMLQEAGIDEISETMHDAIKSSWPVQDMGNNVNDLINWYKAIKMSSEDCGRYWHHQRHREY